MSSILILWFAGASAMARLINIVPRYLPDYGMAPEWGRAVRPVVLVFTGLSVLVTLEFRADVNAQAGAGADATGILAMWCPGRSASRSAPSFATSDAPGVAFVVLTLVLLDALVENVRQKPGGLLIISALFILAIIAVSLVSRVSRTTELRADRIDSTRRPVDS